MRKPPQPWQWKARNNAWYVTIRGKQIWLAASDADEATVKERYAQALGAAQTETEGDRAQVVPLLERYLDYVQNNLKSSTYNIRRRRLQSFARYLKETSQLSLTVRQLRAFHVTNWLAEHPKWDGEKRNAIISVKAAISWAEKEGYITKNPIKHYEVPPAKSRGAKANIEEEDYIRMLAECKQDAHRYLLMALRHTGARPGELYNATAEDFNSRDRTLRCWEHKMDGTVAERIIGLTPLMVELFTKLKGKHPTGPLFRNTEGQPWKGHAARSFFRRLRRRLGLKEDIIPYSGRHTLATSLLAAGASDAKVAKLLGHKGTAMIHRHYSGLKLKDAMPALDSLKVLDGETV
jgi:integrase